MSTINGRIYMDSDMLESYANYNEAANSFLDGIALENIGLDTEIQINFGISDDDVFSDHAMEAIGETVKNMASKAKSNFVTYAKKLINFLFGWLIRFFQGAVKVKEGMKKSYEKARTYLKKLNEFERQARGASQEDKIEITDWGNCVLVGLVMIQAIIVSSNSIGSGLKETAAATGTNENKETTSRGFNMMNTLLERLQKLYAVIGSIDISKPTELLSKLKAANYNIPEMIKGFDGAATELANKSSKEADKELNESGEKVKAEKDRMLGTMSSDAAKETANAQNTRKSLDKSVSKLESTYKSRLEDTAKYMSEPDKAEMSLTQAYDELRMKLKLFLDISKANKWDLEKNISAAEKIRRGLEKEINAIDMTTANEKDVSALLQKIMSVGNNLGQIQRSAGIVVKQVVSCIDGLTVDVAKLGSRVVKLGQPSE